MWLWEVIDFAFWICHCGWINGSEGGLRWRCRIRKLCSFLFPSYILRNSLLYAHFSQEGVIQILEGFSAWNATDWKGCKLVEFCPFISDWKPITTALVQHIVTFSQRYIFSQRNTRNSPTRASYVVTLSKMFDRPPSRIVGVTIILLYCTPNWRASCLKERHWPGWSYISNMHDLVHCCMHQWWIHSSPTVRILVNVKFNQAWRWYLMDGTLLFARLEEICSSGRNLYHINMPTCASGKEVSANWFWDDQRFYTTYITLQGRQIWLGCPEPTIKKHN